MNTTLGDALWDWFCICFFAPVGIALAVLVMTGVNTILSIKSTFKLGYAICRLPVQYKLTTY